MLLGVQALHLRVGARKYDDRYRRKAKQNAECDEKFKEPAFADQPSRKATAGRRGFGSGFLFHRMGVWVDCWSSSKRSGAYQRNFLFPVLLISLGSKTGTPFLAERAKKCQHYFWIFLPRIYPEGLR